ncbi:hypothetical protein FRB91_007114 [Serendipita sp. 411]|nr:hypothetical protein FRB91_007114 [Serendipita sp. 411]
MNLEVKNAIEAAMNDTFNMFAATMDSGERVPKLVVAHHMVGNTYPYTVEDWKRDIQLASSHSIDGFVLNVGRDDWMTARVDDAYAAAQSVGNGFKLCLSLDMTSLPCATLQDVQTLQHWVSRYAHHPNQLIYRGKPLVSTFAGEGCTYGGSFATAWTEFKKGLGGNIHFVPSLFTNPAILNTLPFLDGIFNWNGGWPTQLNEQSSASQIEQAINSLNTDALLLSGMSDKTYTAAVSPWFFTHYGPDTWNKNWIYRGDDWLFAKRWEELIGMRDRVGIVEVISWNDYGESHYIGPIAGAQPNSQAWVDGFDHQGWLEMTSYYAQAFKTGSFPVIAEDKVFVWARPHPKDASAPDHVPRPQFADLTDDFFWVVIFAKSPATAILHAPPPNLDSNSVDHNAAMIVDIPAGVHKLRYPLLPGRTMAVRLERSGNVDLDYRADGFVFNPSPNVYNFNAWVGWKTGS